MTTAALEQLNLPIEIDAVKVAREGPNGISANAPPRVIWAHMEEDVTGEALRLAKELHAPIDDKDLALFLTDTM